MLKAGKFTGDGDCHKLLRISVVHLQLALLRNKKQIHKTNRNVVCTDEASGLPGVFQIDSVGIHADGMHQAGVQPAREE